MRTRVYTMAMALFMCACSSVKVRSTPAPGASLGQYRTFAFMMPKSPSSTTMQLIQSPAGQEIRNSVAQALINKGYTPAQPGQTPDFLIAYHTVLQNKLEVSDWGYGGPWVMGPGPVTVSEYTEGTIVVDFIDPRTNQAFWRGTAESIVKDPSNPDVRKVAKAVDKLMAKYPTSIATSGGPTRM